MGTAPEHPHFDPHSTPQPTPPLKLSAIVLAGGQSSRMGQDKALVEVGQVPMLLQVCQITQQCADTVYVVTPWTERYQTLLGSLLDDRTHHTQLIQEHPLPNEMILHGPLVGFAQGLAHVQTEWVLLLACDLPRLEVSVLKAWAAELPKADNQTVALLPQHPQGWWEALCGFYRRRCLPDLEDFIRQGGRSFQRWLSYQSVQELPLANRDMLFNCNTPEDVKRLNREV